MPSSLNHRSLKRVLGFAAISAALVAVVSFLVLWQATAASARKTTPPATSYFAPTHSALDTSVITPAAGNTITVNSTSDAANATDGLCTLREAITAANSNTASGVVSGECGAGGSSGSDTIDLTGVSGTISLTSALPDITSDMSLNGPGASSLTIQRSTAGGTANFRIFTINSGTIIAISSLTIGNGNAGGGSFPTNSGGGILNSGSLTLVNSVISGNAATGSGGGIYVDQGTLSSDTSVITGNNAASGAGISNQGTTTINQTTVSGNTAVGSGGGIANSSGGNQSSVLTVNNSTISNNSSQGGNGGGIFNIGQASASNSTISSNTAGTGGGISNANPMTLTSVTISGNTGTGQGGGIYNPGIGTLTFTNTIIAGNNSPSGPDGNGANFISQDYNLIGNTSGAQINGTTAHNITNVNALLGPLANNGGPTLTHSLLPGSPAIDAGNTSALITYQRGAGFNRAADGDGDGNATVDEFE
jgi:CSLREA domain-containing protein